MVNIERSPDHIIIVFYQMLPNHLDMANYHYIAFNNEPYYSYAINNKTKINLLQYFSLIMAGMPTEF